MLVPGVESRAGFGTYARKTAENSGRFSAGLAVDLIVFAEEPENYIKTQDAK
jgi:hypothetical protein